jgi:DNA-binding XRE family transcriptional regulator
MMINETHPLRRWRQGHSISQATLAKEIGVVPTHICQIERRTRLPSLSLGARLAAHTGIPLVDFLPPDEAAA